MSVQQAIEPCTLPTTQQEIDPKEALSFSPITDEKREKQARRAAMARAKSGRRRLIDPTTSERDYSEAEKEFMFAIQEYKRTSGRMFPTWSEVLEVLQSLGYRKLEAQQD